MYAYYNTKTWADKKVYVEMVRETVESAISNALDEKKAWLEAALEEGVEIHEPRESVLRISSFEEWCGILKIAIICKQQSMLLRAECTVTWKEPMKK